MSTMKVPWLPLLATVFSIGLPVAAHHLRHGEEPGCAFDGTKIVELYRVDVVDAGGQARAFCCPRCARLWLKRQQQPPRAITLRDESTGERLDASAAWYVLSSVRTSQANGNQVHVFARRVDAEKHAATFRGGLLSQAESPFALCR
jgi:hypothetical protein